MKPWNSFQSAASYLFWNATNKNIPTTPNGILRNHTCHCDSCEITSEEKNIYSKEALIML